ncbi:MAG: response regulator [Rikenellaceae bacterium]
MKRFISIIFVVVMAIFDSSANPNYQYSIKQLSLPDGLSSFTVNSMAKDQRGTLWLATNNGINRVYGRNIDHYSLAAESSGENRIIKHIFCDKEGQVWAISRYYVSRYNSHNNRFEQVHDGAGSIFSALSFYLVDDGILFGGAGKVYKYLYATKEIKPIFSSDSTPLSFFYGITQIDGNKIIVSNNVDGVYCIDPATSSMSLISEQDDKIIASGVYVDRESRLWIPYTGRGVYIYRVDGDEAKLLKYFSVDNSQLTNNTITNIRESGDEVWVTTDGGGVNIINFDRDEVSQPNVQPSAVSPFLKSARYILGDGSNWYIGSTKGALLTLNKSYFSNYVVNPYNSSLGPNFPVVLCLAECDGLIWLGTDGGGVNIFDPQSEQFKVVESTQEMKVVNLIEIDDDNFMISAYGSGAFKLNKHTHRLTPIGSVNSAISKNTINKFEKINASQILILGWDRLVYDIDNDQISLVDDQLIRNAFLEFAATSNPSRHVAYSSDEIFSITEESPNVKMTSIYKSTNDIDDVVVDKEGAIWFCDSEGLKCLDESTHQGGASLHTLRARVNTMLCDGENRIWIGNDKGVSCYNIDSSSLNAWGKTDGVLIADFLARSSVVSSSGDIYLGGIEGVLRIKNNIPLQEQVERELDVISVEVDDIHHPLKYANQLPLIKTSASFSEVTLKIATDNENVLDNYTATYTVNSLLHSMSIACFDNVLSIPKLPAGRYDINVIRGRDQETAKIATLIIPRPLLLRWWAIALYVVALSALFITLYRYTLARKQREMMWIMSNNERQLADEKIRFFINLSHELRTPLTLIHSPIKRLLSDSSLSENAKQSLQRVLTQANHTFNLVNMVLDIRKLEVDSDKLNLSCCDVGSWVEYIASEFEYEFKAHGITLKMEIEESLPPIMIDADKCRSVLSNILMNAQKYATGRGVVTLRGEVVGSSIRISVVDEWNGVDPQIIDSLFSRFYQSKNSNVGYGIGLSYSKEIIERHNGQIGVFNNQTKGATFYFDIPVWEGAVVTTVSSSELQSYGAAELVERAVEQFDTSNSSILIVDDNSDIVDELKAIFAPEFKKVHYANNGQEALSLLHQCKPDIVVSDIMMPIMNGFELCKSLKTDIEISHIPIILLTARADAQSNITGYKMGADNYITKPFDSDLLLEAVRNELSKRVQVKERIQANNLNIDIASDLNSNADCKLIEKLNEFIVINLADENLNLDMILQHLCMSRTSFKNKFFAITNSNINISQYINNFRIERAKVLLSTTNLSISEIAFLVGFASVAYFGSTFKKSTELTPKVFRDSHKS